MRLISADHNVSLDDVLRRAERLTRSVTLMLAHQGVDLKRVPPKCLVRPPPESKTSVLVRGSGPQGLRRPRFSFFLFTCQTARGPGGPRSPVNRRAVEAFRPRQRSGASSPSPVRSFEGAPSRREADGAPYSAIYSRRDPAMSTPKARNIASFALQRLPRNRSSATCGRRPFPCREESRRRTAATFLQPTSSGGRC
jgi:hypothetical protein